MRCIQWMIYSQGKYWSWFMATIFRIRTPIMTRKNYNPKKKVQSSSWLCISNHWEKLRPPPKKRYSRLTDGWNKSQITVCHVKYEHTNYDWKKLWLEKKYDTVVWSSVMSKYKHHQSHFNLRKFLLSFFILQKQFDPNFLLVCIAFLLCMDLQPYSHDCFSKISRTLFDFLNNTYWVSLF